MSDVEYLSERFKKFIHQDTFPCVGAKSALARGTLEILLARDMRSNWADRRIYEGLEHIIESYRQD